MQRDRRRPSDQRASLGRMASAQAMVCASTAIEPQMPGFVRRPDGLRRPDCLWRPRNFARSGNPTMPNYGPRRTRGCEVPSPNMDGHHASLDPMGCGNPVSCGNTAEQRRSPRPRRAREVERASPMGAMGIPWRVATQCVMASSWVLDPPWALASDGVPGQATVGAEKTCYPNTDSQEHGINPSDPGEIPGHRVLQTQLNRVAPDPQGP